MRRLVAEMDARYDADRMFVQRCYYIITGILPAILFCTIAQAGTQKTNPITPKIVREGKYFIFSRDAFKDRYQLKIQYINFVPYYAVGFANTNRLSTGTQLIAKDRRLSYTQTFTYIDEMGGYDDAVNMILNAKGHAISVALAKGYIFDECESSDEPQKKSATSEKWQKITNVFLYANQVASNGKFYFCGTTHATYKNLETLMHNEPIESKWVPTLLDVEGNPLPLPEQANLFI